MYKGLWGLRHFFSLRLSCQTELRMQSTSGSGQILIQCSLCPSSAPSQLLCLDLVTCWCLSLQKHSHFDCHLFIYQSFESYHWLLVRTIDHQCTVLIVCSASTPVNTTHTHGTWTEQRAESITVKFFSPSSVQFVVCAYIMSMYSLIILTLLMYFGVLPPSHCAHFLIHSHILVNSTNYLQLIVSFHRKSQL